MSATTESTAMDPGTSRGSRGSLEKGDRLVKRATKARMRENAVNAPPKKLKKKGLLHELGSYYNSSLHLDFNKHDFALGIFWYCTCELL